MNRIRKLLDKKLLLISVVTIFIGMIGYQVFAAPKDRALKIKDLENVALSPEAKPILGRSEWHFETSDGTFLGILIIEDGRTIYSDGTSSNRPSPLIITYYSPDAVEAGSSLEITYDDDRVLEIYLPNLSYTTTLYVTKEGSTYYDATLTQLAQEASLETEDLSLETKEASSPESQEYFKWEAEYHRRSYKGVEAEGLALGLEGYVIFRFKPPLPKASLLRTFPLPLLSQMVVLTKRPLLLVEQGLI